MEMTCMRTVRDVLPKTITDGSVMYTRDRLVNVDYHNLSDCGHAATSDSPVPVDPDVYYWARYRQANGHFFEMFFDDERHVEQGRGQLHAEEVREFVAGRYVPQALRYPNGLLQETY